MSTTSDNKRKLESFFKEEYVALKSYVGSRLKASTERDPEDIIQDVALNLFTGADRYAPITNVTGLVYRSIKNKIVDVMRKGKPNATPVEENEARWIEFAELMYGTADNSYDEAMIQALKETIHELNPAYRDIIIAVDFEGYSYKEIASATGTPEGTLMSRRHRALSKLYNALKHKKLITNRI